MLKSVILLAALTHFVWAFCIVLAPTTLQITGVSVLEHVPPYVASFLFTAASVMAIWSFYIHNAFASLLLWPQQSILIISAYGAVESVVRGSYADGYIPDVSPHLFILADQVAVVLLAFLHIVILFVDTFSHEPYRTSYHAQRKRFQRADLN